MIAVAVLCFCGESRQYKGIIEHFSCVLEIKAAKKPELETTDKHKQEFGFFCEEHYAQTRAV